MGMQRTVRYTPGGVPGWDAVRAQLERVGVTAALKMIDGLPAFPDEVPEPGWTELRVGTHGGMVTIRAAADALACVIWGNATDQFRRDWDAVCWACAAAGDGRIESENGVTTADEFARQAGLSPA